MHALFATTTLALASPPPPAEVVEDEASDAVTGESLLSPKESSETWTVLYVLRAVAASAALTLIPISRARTGLKQSRRDRNVSEFGCLRKAILNKAWDAGLV